MKITNTILAALLFTLFSTAAITQTACKAPQQVVAYKTIASIQASVAAARDAFLLANAQGLVSEDDKRMAVELSTKFNVEFNRAITVAQAMDAPAPEFLTTAATEFLLFAAQYMTR